MESISKFFSGIAAKKLSKVEIDPETSNQHEFNGVDQLKKIFGENKIEFSGTFIYLGVDETNNQYDYGKLTWYDSRQNHPTRSEFRLYYNSNAVIEKACEEDILVLARQDVDKMAVIIIEQGAKAEDQIKWLFEFNEISGKFKVRNLLENDFELDYSGKYVLNILGIETENSDEKYLDDLIKNFDDTFPTTRVFSKFTRDQFEKDIFSDPDSALLSFLEREEKLFKVFEKYIIEKRLKRGFGDTGVNVNDFLTYSLSVQNRRKSRAGYSFENHLSAIFDFHEIMFSRGEKTEGNNKPDFIFPGIEFYRDPLFPDENLCMLGVKTSLKDRWRQILTEAERIKKKHLATLEVSISKNQTDEIINQGVNLVIPNEIIKTYSEMQAKHIMSISEFIEMIKDIQNS